MSSYPCVRLQGIHSSCDIRDELLANIRFFHPFGEQKCKLLIIKAVASSRLLTRAAIRSDNGKFLSAFAVKAETRPSSQTRRVQDRLAFASCHPLPCRHSEGSARLISTFKAFGPGGRAL